MISICTVTYNSLEFLKILYASIKKNTKIKYEFVVHDNGSEDGTAEWLKHNNIKHSVGMRNEGASALNYAVEQAKFKHVFLPNPDNYLLPGWDVDLIKQINEFKSKRISKYIVCHRQIEPLGNNPEYIIHNCGYTPDTFNEDKLLSFYFDNFSNLGKCDTIQYSFPNCLPRELWLEVGGMDLEYFPGWTADVDFALKLYKAGCRHFKLLSVPRTYHFISGTCRKLPKEINAQNGWDLFKSKWGMSVEEFRKRLFITEPYRELQDSLLDLGKQR